MARVRKYGPYGAYWVTTPSRPKRSNNRYAAAQRRKRAPRRVRAAPFSLLDRVDRKRKRTVPYRSVPVKTLKRRAAAGRRARRDYRRGKPVRTGGKKYQVRTAGGGVALVTGRQYRQAMAEFQRNWAAAEKEARRLGHRNALAQRRSQTLQRPNVRKAQIAGVKFPIASGTVNRYARIANRNILPVKLATSTGPELGRLGTRAVHDAFSLPVQIPVGAYYTGRAGLKAVGGDTREAEQLWKAFKTTDPVALAVQGKFREAAREAGEHPLLAALEVGGGVGAVARTGARIGRGGGSKPRLRPRGVPQTGLVQHRTGGVVRRRRATTARRKTAGLVQKARAADARGETARADDLYRKAASKDPDRVPESYIEQRVDAFEGMVQSQRRPGRAATAKATRQAIRGPNARLGRRRANRANHPGSLVSLVAQGIVNPDMNDVKRYAAELDAVAKTLPRERLRQNRATRAQVAKVINGKVDMASVIAAADRVVEVQRPLEAKLLEQSVLTRGEAEGSKRIASEAREGRRTLADPEDLAFVTHSPRASVRGAFNVSGRKAQGIRPQGRTGEAVRQGLLDLDPERVVEQNVKMRGVADAVDNFGSFLREFGLRDRGGKPKVFKSKAEAADAARKASVDPEGNPITGAHEMVPVKAKPFAGREEQMRKMLDVGDEEGFLPDKKHPVSEALQDALRGKGDDDGGWVLIPKAAADRLYEHAGVVAAQSPTLRAVSQAFRRTVLPFSPSWVTGNVVEGGLRTAIFKARPGDRRRFNRVHAELARLDPAAAEQLLHRVPSGHFGGVSETMIHTSAAQFGNSKVAPMARALEALAKKPGAKQVAGAFRKYTDWMFGTANAMLEAQWARSMAGAHIRRELINKKDRQGMETAVEQAARGLRNTSEQARMADVVRRAYGQYDSFSPGMRKLILGYTPFGAWTINATKFLFSVLPKDHPGLTAIAAANHQLTEDWRNTKGLDQWATKPLPGFLQGSVPLPGGGHLRVARYTPFGLMASPLDTVAGNVLPFANGPLMTFRGLDWKGDPLRRNGKELDDPTKILYAGREFAYATVPLIGQIARGLEKDGTPLQKALQVLNPLNPVKPRKETSSSSSGGSSSSSGPKTPAQQFEDYQRNESNIAEEFEEFERNWNR